MRAGARLLRPLERLLGARGIDECAPEHQGLSGHVIIAGYGVAAEEVGLDLEVLGPCVWTRTHVVPIFDGRWDGQVERFFLVEVERFEPAPLLTAEQLRAEFVTEVRWWTAANLAASTELHAPRRLPDLVAQLRDSGPPLRPIDAGV